MTLELSIPDALATAAHRVATELGMSRSELYARALAAFLHSESEIVRTERSRRKELQDPVWTQDGSPHRS